MSSTCYLNNNNDVEATAVLADDGKLTVKGVDNDTHLYETLSVSSHIFKFSFLKASAIKLESN